MEWFSESLKRAEFTTLDVKDFAKKVKQDKSNMGLYLDAPWWKVGAPYRHSVSACDEREFHTWIRDWLLGYENVRIVVRYGDHPGIRELYKGGGFHLMEEIGRKQGGANSELWITRNIPLGMPEIAEKEPAEAAPDDGKLF